MAPGGSACKEVLESHLTFSDYDTAKPKSETNSNITITKSSTMSGGKHGTNSKNGVNDLLECPVCNNLMYPPIHQCPNGHTLCSDCKVRVHNSCPTCRYDLGNIRCLALEKVAESLELPCRYQNLGCHDIFPYYTKLKHEQNCRFRPYNCPYAGSECSVMGDIPTLVTHLKEDHKVDMHEGCTFNHRYVKSNPHEVENATWMLTVFNCFGRHFCLHFEAFQLGMAPVYMAFLHKSYEVTQPPGDSVSSLSFSPKANFLVATSWDNQVRCWEIVRNGAIVNSTAKASISHDQPVLCSTWKDDGTTVFSGGCDKQVKMWPLLSGGQPMTVAMHDAPIKDIAWIPEMNLLATGSWDKTLKYWDTRQSNPVHTQQLPDRCYAMSVKHPLMVVGTADRNLIVFNLQNPQTEFKRIMSPLKYQTRCVTAFPDQQGFLVGSIEGRVGVHHLDDVQQSKNFTFKCHRDGNDIYSVNALNFHPIHHTFATAGSDGAFNFWDKDSKQRLKAMQRCNQPIPCSTFNNDGSIFAYAVCYDWGKGAENHNPATAKTYIYLHLPQETEVKGKPRSGTTGRK